MALTSPELEILGYTISFGQLSRKRENFHFVVLIYGAISRKHRYTCFIVCSPCNHVCGLICILILGGHPLLDQSANIFRIYQAIQKEVESDPEARSRVPGFFQERKPFLAKGAEGPLSGEIHNAQYFHGRSVHNQHLSHCGPIILFCDIDDFIPLPLPLYSLFLCCVGTAWVTPRKRTQTSTFPHL